MSSGTKRLGRLVRLVHLCRQDRELLRLVHSVDHFLRPGIYTRESAALWRRAGSAVPNHARRTKGVSNDGRFFRLLRALTSWFSVSRSSHGTGEVVLAAFDGGVIVLDTFRKQVYRTYGTGAVSQEYIEWRRIYTRHVTAPAFSVSADRETITEELIDGIHLLDANPRTRLNALRNLLLQYAALARAEGCTRECRIEEELGEALSIARLPTSFRDRYRQCTTGWFAQPVVWVPSAYEATAKNLMLRADGSPAPIDLGDLSPDPCFVYPVGMITVAGSRVLLRYLEGALDDALAELFQAAGRSWIRERSAREGLLLERLAYAAMRDSYTPGGLDLNRFSDSVERRWAALCSMPWLFVGR